MYEYECFQKEQLIKELLLVENHLAVFVCPHCLHKHSLTVSALAEETLKITPIAKEQELLKRIIEMFKRPTKEEQLNSIRDLRKELMAVTPNPCNPVKICGSSKTCMLNLTHDKAEETFKFHSKS